MQHPVFAWYDGMNRTRLHHSHLAQGCDDIRIPISSPQPRECTTLSRLPDAVEGLSPHIVLFGHSLKSHGWDTPVGRYVGSDAAKVIRLVSKLVGATASRVRGRISWSVSQDLLALSAPDRPTGSLQRQDLVRPQINGDLLESFTIFPKQEQSKGLDGLTPRQRQIVTLVQQGLTNQEIARHVLVSEAAVAWSLTRIYRHFGVGDRIRLITTLHAKGA